MPGMTRGGLRQASCIVAPDPGNGEDVVRREYAAARIAVGIEFVSQRA